MKIEQTEYEEIVSRFINKNVEIAYTFFQRIFH